MMTVILAWLRWVLAQVRAWLAPGGSSGGVSIGGNVTVGRDFVGRDRIDNQERKTDE